MERFAWTTESQAILPVHIVRVKLKHHSLPDKSFRITRYSTEDQLLSVLPPTLLLRVFSCVWLSHRLKYVKSQSVSYSCTDYHLQQPYWLTPLCWDFSLPTLFPIHTLPYINSILGLQAFFLDSCTPRMGLIGCPETLVGNYHYLLCNNPEEYSSLLLHSGSLKSVI